MKARLIEIVRERVANGEITESQLGRQTGISQSHIHNVLKGVKVLKTELADDMLRQLRIKAEDLLPAAQGVELRASVPLLTGTVGSGVREFCPQQTNGDVPVPRHLTAVAKQLIAVCLCDDDAMAPYFAAGDVVLVDTNVFPDSGFVDGIYIVMTKHGPRLRHLRRSCSRLYFSSACGIHHPWAWESSSHEGSSCDVVQGRAVWLTRQIAPTYDV